MTVLSGPALTRLTRVVAVGRRHYWVLKRSPHRAFDVVFWPVVDTLLFGSIGTAYGRGPSVLFLLSGVVLWHVVYQAQIAVSTGFLEETWTRNLVSLMVAPLSEGEYLAGTALFGLVKLVLGVGAVALTALGFYAFDVTSLGLGLIPVTALLLLSGWVVAIIVIGIVLRYGTGAEALVWGVLFVLMPLSGTFYPVSALPGLLQPLALALPTTHAFTAARQLVAGGPFPWGELALSAGLTVAAGAAALAYATRMLRVFRRRGYITRYS